ncbi:MAG: putative nicotinate-nucleotide adenylyltransferase [Thermodesulfobacteriota bacterium]|nr:MAG: putative nicotinate-nucleotide adenylyltransferase [Thermodesulfobacteriota bacterium]
MGTNKQKRVGLFGGTFDPIHFGHLRAAEEIKEILSLDRVYFIPSAIPPHKSDSKITNSSKRLEMLRLAIEGNKYFDLSVFELQSETPSYTIKTLEYFNHAEPNTEYYFILGNEQFNHIESWKDYKRLFELSNFAVITRPGFSEPGLNKVPLALKDDFLYYNCIENVISYTNKTKDIVFIEIKGIEISSTDIRTFVKSKKSIKYLVPDKVENFILSEKLYD